ncbi:MAG: hypothetical protein IKZ29_10460 [Clostridiales bacterium]|nr:hypothetical protein [Clostridiales bacterium]MBR4948968.1 hypothetical protein [Clostridiales bacterium]
MSRGKTGLIVLTVFAMMFILFIAILFGSSTKRQQAIDRKAALDANIDTIIAADTTIYWIGDPPPEELEHLMPVVNVITPESASEDNLPVKSPLFHTQVHDSFGRLVSEQIPVEYTDKLVIVISGTPNLTQAGSEALLNSIAQNGVPVIAIGNDASEALGSILSYRRIKMGDGSSLYYCLGAGYTENPLSEEAVKAGGMDLAEAVTGQITLALSDYTPQELR